MFGKFINELDSYCIVMNVCGTSNNSRDEIKDNIFQDYH